MSSNLPTNDKPLNVWDYKPWWCQPWSILLTGLTLIAGSWIFFKTWWLTLLLALPVLTWMGFFILIWPKLMLQSGILEAYQQSVPTVPPQE